MEATDSVADRKLQHGDESREALEAEALIQKKRREACVRKGQQDFMAACDRVHLLFFVPGCEPYHGMYDGGSDNLTFSLTCRPPVLFEKHESMSLLVKQRGIKHELKMVDFLIEDGGTMCLRFWTWEPNESMLDDIPMPEVRIRPEYLTLAPYGRSTIPYPDWYEGNVYSTIDEFEIHKTEFPCTIVFIPNAEAFAPKTLERDEEDSEGRESR